MKTTQKNILEKIVDSIKSKMSKRLKKMKLKNRYMKEGYYKELPENITENQKKIVLIFKEMLYAKLAKLSHNTKTNETCISIEKDEKVFYMFITDTNIRFINTIHESDNEANITDTPINDGIYNYIMHLYYSKQNIDFTKFVKYTNMKISHSLQESLNNVIQINKEQKDNN